MVSRYRGWQPGLQALQQRLREPICAYDDVGRMENVRYVRQQMPSRQCVAAIESSR